MDAISVSLDRPRGLRYTLGDMKELCRVMSRMQLGDSPLKVTGQKLIMLLAEKDPDAMIQALYHGLKWEDRSLKADRMEIILQDFLASGGDWDVVSDAIVDALVVGGHVKLPNRPKPSPNGSGASGS